MQFNYKCLSDTGKVRQANEDSLGDLLTPNGHVFVVCDGMGGHVGGARASSLAVQSILQYFSKEEYANIIQAIDRALVFANEQIYATTLAEPELKGMGTTAVVLVVKNEECYIGHVGDSRIYFKSEGKLNRLTKDHSFVQSLVDSGVISDEEAEHHPKKNQILKALGIYPQVEPTICSSPVQAKNGDVFLLCSDGMNGMVNDSSMEMMVESGDLERSAINLINAANDAGGHDNITVTLVGVTESPFVKSKFQHYNPRPNFAATATQGISDSSPKSRVGSNSKKWWIVGAISLLVIVIAAGSYFMFLNDEPKELTELPPKGVTISESEVARWPEAQINELKGREVETDEESLLASNNKYVVMIDQGKIVDLSVNNSEKPDRVSVVKKKETNTSNKNEKKPLSTDSDTLSIPQIKEDNKTIECIKKQHIVKEKESTYSIVRQYNKVKCKTSEKQLQKENPKKDLSKINPGDTLMIPCNCPE